MAPNSLEVVLTGKKDDTRVNEKQAATRQIDWIRNSKTASDPTLLIISASASACQYHFSSQSWFSKLTC